MNNSNVIESLPILILFPHSRCNCRCIMCDIWKVKTVEEITPSELEKHARDIEDLGVRWVVFSGGEPLMHSDLFRLSNTVRERGIRSTILSSGLQLADKAAAIAGNVDEVIVSLDGPPQTHDRVRGIRGAFEHLAAGVRAVHAVKADFPIAARSTVQRWNFPFLRQTVRTAEELGLQSISFLAADLTSTAFNRPDGWPAARQERVGLTVEETEELEQEIERLIDELELHQGFVLETPDKLRRIVRHFKAHLGLADLLAPKCNAPWVSAVVESDGTVHPCFFHRAIGNLKRQPLPEILNGPQALEFRSNLDISNDPICQRCVCSLYLEPGRNWPTKLNLNPERLWQGRVS